VSSLSPRLIVSLLVLALVGVAFWMLLLGPKREEAGDLATELDQQRAALAQNQAKANAGAEARRDFPGDYRQLVVLGKAVPAGDDTGSLLVELNQIAKDSGVSFQSIQLSNGAGESSAEPTTTEATGTAGGASTPVPATEVAAALLPLGATIGTAGLGVMPYDLVFTGDFFHVADFIHGVDSLVQPSRSNVAVEGRLVTLDGFALNAAPDGFPNLEATFAVTTYLAPPGQGVTAGATAEAPPTETPASETPR